MKSLRGLLVLVSAFCAVVALVGAAFSMPLVALSALMALIVLFYCMRELRLSGSAVSTTLASPGLDQQALQSQGQSRALLIVMLFVGCCFGCYVLLKILPAFEQAGDSVKPGFWFFSLVVCIWALGWLLVEWLADVRTHNAFVNRVLGILIPVLFGAGLLMLWEVLTRALNVPQVLLPSPSLIADRFASSTSVLWADFKQTFLKAVLVGYAIGCLSGLLVAILIDRSPFLQRGLLPVGNMVSALPIVGIAPIMVMWFGFDWPSKAAVVVVMTFFPMMVNTISGLSAANHMQLDLMKTYAAGYWQNLFKLRLPEAMPFIFNALKINSTLALIGAIVAEFFGTPIVGMGFRISTEVGRMNVDMVWAEIAVAAIAGSCFYGLVAMIERMLTFWHPSIRAT